jgi:hypothetical protein
MTSETAWAEVLLSDIRPEIDAHCSAGPESMGRSISLCHSGFRRKHIR